MEAWDLNWSCIVCQKMYKLAFIGGGIGSIAGYPHFIASQMDKKFKVVAGAFSRDKENNKKTAEMWGVNRIYDNWKEMIEKEYKIIHAVVILVHTPLHAEIILKLLEKNIPIICEKSIVGSMEEIRNIEKKYDPNRHFLVVTNNYSGYLMVRELRERIKQNEFGNILHIRLKMPQESFLRPPRNIKYPQKWRLKDEYIPTISLDLGVHLHHLAYFLLKEEPAEVFAEYSSFSQYNIIDEINIMLRYKSGIKGNFWISKTALGNRNGLTIEIYGDKGSAIWIQENPEKIEISYFNGEKNIIDRGCKLLSNAKPTYNRMTVGHPAGFIEAFANIYYDIADLLDIYFNNQKLKSDFIFGLEHAKNGLKLLHKASDSANSSQWFKVKS